MEALSPEEEFVLVIRAREGDAEATTRLAYSLRRMVAAIARQIGRAAVRMGVDLEDLEQEGYLGILEAIKSFDPTKGARFASYSWYKISWRVRDFCERHAKHATRSLDSMPYVNEEFRLGEYADGDDSRPQSLYDLLGDGTPRPDQRQERAEIHEALMRAVERLPHDMRWAIEATYGIGREPVGQAEIAQELGIARQGAGQLIQQAMSSIKNSMKFAED